VKANALDLTGLDDLVEALKRLPPELVHEGAAIVEAHATEAGRQIEASYPVATGNLKSHVVVAVETSAVHATARVQSTAKHAWIFEHGTAERHWKRNNKNTGTMPQHKNTASFVDIAVRRRALMVNALIELVERAGLTVSGR